MVSSSCSTSGTRRINLVTPGDRSSRSSLSVVSSSRRSTISKRSRGRDRMVVGFTATCAISTYHHWSCEFEPRSWEGVLDMTLCDKVYHWLDTVTGWWFSPGTPVSSINKSDRHDINEILMKVALNTINPTTTQRISSDNKVNLQTFIFPRKEE